MKSITIKRVQVVENNLINKNKFIFRVDTKSKDNKTKNKQVELHQTKNPHNKKKTSKTRNSNLWSGRKYLLMTYVICGYYPKERKSSYNSMTTTTTMIQKWSEELNKHFFQRRVIDN